MKNKQIRSITILVLFLLGCNTMKDNNLDYVFTLNPTGKKIWFSLDVNTKPETESLFLFNSKQGIEYLTFLNDYTNSILFFDIEDQKLECQIKLNKEGPNSTGRICGFKVISEDSVFVLVYNKPSLYLVNKKGLIQKKINYERTSDSSPLYPSDGSSFIYTPMVYNSKKIYLTQMPILSDKICIEISMLNDSIKYLPMVHPDLDKQNVENNVFSRDFDGENFIYSFRNDPNIYITKNHKDYYSKKADSYYIDKITPIEISRDATLEQGRKVNIETPYYGAVIYDSYREVYYRFAYPGVETNKNDNLKMLWSYLRTFSIIILDKEFTKVGEYLLPENRYNMKMIFIGKDGLFISTNHLMNPEYDENKLTFELFKLVKQK